MIPRIFLFRAYVLAAMTALAFGACSKHSASKTPFIPANTNPPDVPTNLHGTVTARGAVSLAWDTPHDDDGVVGYELWRNGGLLVRIEASSFVDPSAPLWTPAEYGVRAYDHFDNISDLSAPFEITPALHIADVVGSWSGSLVSTISNRDEGSVAFTIAADSSISGTISNFLLYAPDPLNPGAYFTCSNRISTAASGYWAGQRAVINALPSSGGSDNCAVSGGSDTLVFQGWNRAAGSYRIFGIVGSGGGSVTGTVSVTR